jgi:hypothetical protein
VHAATTEDKAATGEPAMKIILGQPKVGNRMLKLKSIEDEKETLTLPITPMISINRQPTTITFSNIYRVSRMS